MNPNTAEQKEIKKTKMGNSRQWGKFSFAMMQAVHAAIDGEEVLYSTPKGNLIIRSVENDTQLITQKQKEAVEGFEEMLFHNFMDCPSDEKYTKKDIKAVLAVVLNEYICQLENEGKEQK